MFTFEYTKIKLSDFMKNILIFSSVYLITVFSIIAQTSGNKYFFASWNVENLFDTIDDKGKNDEEFTPSSKKQWTGERLKIKLDNIAKVINYMNSGNAPDVMGFQEVEHKSLIDSIVMRVKKYEIIHAESPDNRGIDNALIFDSNKFNLISYKVIRVNLGGNRHTRDILRVDLIDKENNVFYFYVNHWPSRLGGQEKSEPLRIKAAEILKKDIDRIYLYNKNPNIICLGDFNDEPNNISISEKLKAFKFDCKNIPSENEKLINLSYNKFINNQGTIKFRGDFNLIDQIIISKNLFNRIGNVEKCELFKIINPSWMLQKDGQYSGACIPTYGGNKYFGGFSDHLPVSIEFLFN